MRVGRTAKKDQRTGHGSQIPRVHAVVVAVVVTLLLALAAAVSPAAVLAQSAPAPVRDAARHALTIRAYDASGAIMAQGSGFLFGSGRVATSYHVIRRASSVRIVGADGETIAEVRQAVTVDEDRDIAILPAPAGHGPGLRLETLVPDVGDRVWAYGSPRGLTGTMTDGIVSAVRERGGHEVIQTSAPISAGSSGGPVLNADGRVIGVTMSSVAGGQNLNFAIPARELARLAARRGPSLDLPLDAATVAGDTDAADADADHVAGADPGSDGPLSDRWRYLARNASDAALYYDPKTVAREDDHLRIWIYTLYPEPQNAGPAAFDASKALFEFHCGAGRFRLNQYLLLRGERVIGSDGSVEDGEWSAAAPDSVAEGLLRTVCPRASASGAPAS